LFVQNRGRMSSEIYAAEVPFVEQSEYQSKQKLATGFASPAEDYFQRRLNINDWVIKNRTATFFMKVRGGGMKKFGINDEDILVIDRSLKPVPNQLAVVALNGELLIRQLIKEGKMWALLSDAPTRRWISSADDFFVWGVVSFTIHACYDV